MPGWSWRRLFFSFEGRVNRARWWLGMIPLSLVLAGGLWLGGSPEAGEGMSAAVAGSLRIGSFFFGLALLWPLMALTAKRWHDRGKSGWWVLVGLIPVLGQVWILVELGLISGDKGDNAYGPDPLDPLGWFVAHPRSVASSLWGNWETTRDNDQLDTEMVPSIVGWIEQKNS